MVLDGDIDDSAAVVAAAGDLPVRAIVFEENRGRVAALNAGFADATGEVLIRCDDDLRPNPDYVERNVARHRGQPVGVVGLYQNVFPDTDYARVYGRPADVTFRRDAYLVAPEERWRYWAGNASVTRETYDRVGPYDRDYRAYGWEDVDWGYRLLASGVPIVIDPDLETPHHIAATTTESKTLRAFHSGAARHLFESKHGTDHLPGLAALQPTPWNRLVRAFGERWTPGSLARASRVVDRVLGVAPPALGRRLVGLLVESASYAGRRTPELTRTDF